MSELFKKSSFQFVEFVAKKIKDINNEPGLTQNELTVLYFV